MGVLELLPYVAVGLTGALVVQIIAYVSALRQKRVDVIDIAWGMSFIGIIAALRIYEPSNAAWVYVVDLLVLIWGARLSFHIYRRFRRSKIQDERYTSLMSKWPANRRWLQAFLKLFVTQAILATIISLPVIIIHASQPPTQSFVIIGVAIWLIGFAFETTADWQLKQFIAHNKQGELMMDGLWRYSRHPNYFGEITMWWGITLMACSTPLWWIGLIGALTITYLICFVSGIPPAEARAKTKPQWEKYRIETSVLLPWPPKK